ncbi:uncharacterized protein LTR77_010480 [Saxophila tyrrhenica]|uniref:Tyrosine-protein phosphatase domain-containing protein n=1 Tax=Saxophila tyrrhenica TaxID=1690608 RepID=A0AAV9NW22_9PEZI|nr:hypothetical protein LTR77_010480 [Saxophila tyrrhenica]
MALAMLSNAAAKGGLARMNSLPQAPHLYIGGIRALDDPDALDAANITHILSVLEYDACDWPEFSKYRRQLIKIEDYASQNIVQHFSSSNSFLDAVQAEGGIVLIHCYMGISRREEDDDEDDESDDNSDDESDGVKETTS